MKELAPGLHRWTAAHPAWEPGGEPGDPGDWPEQVGSVVYQAPDALDLVDPLVDRWGPLDALVEGHGRPVVVLTTMRFHGRSRARWPSATARSCARTARRRPPACALPIAGMDESMVYLEAPRALVPGDRLIGDRGRPAAVPGVVAALLARRSAGEAALAALAPLLELPVESVLVSHGEPVLRDGAAALRAALG